MKYLLVLFFFPLSLFSQDITGLWAGSLFNDSSGANIRYEIIIDEVKGKYTAYSQTSFIIDNREYTGMKSVLIVKLKDKFIFEDQELISHNYPVAPPKGVKQLTSVTLSQDQGTPLLSGKFTTTRTREYGRKVTGTVRLEKQTDLTQSNLLPAMYKKGLAKNITYLQPGDDVVDVVKEDPRELPSVEKVGQKPSKKDIALVVTTKTNPDVVAELAKRKVETIETVYFTSDSLQLALYDNGFVDGDSVSLIMNGRVLLEHQLLSTKAIEKTIKTPQGIVDSLTLIMYAENLGSIAPNSGLLIIKDGTKRHEITFSGDLQKNAAVVVKRRKG